METRGPMAPQIILVRHARPVIDPQEAAHNWALEPSETGVVARLAASLSAHGADSVVASPEPKARDTGRIIAGELDLPLAMDADLREQGGGQVPWIESAEAFRVAVAGHFARPAEVVLGAESSRAAADRFGKAVERARQNSRCPVIVTHGRVMCGYMASRLGTDAMSIWPTLLMPDALVLDLDARRWRRIEREEVA